jgi:hypothetical protein
LLLFCSWVSGTRTEALLELDYPELSVYSKNGIPLPKHRFSPPTATNNIIAQWYAIRPANETQQMAVVAGGAAADPASLGVAWILAASSLKNKAYWTIVDQEANYLLSVVKRTNDSAISMRPNDEPVQLWNDFVCEDLSLPPFFGPADVFADHGSQTWFLPFLLTTE